MTFDDIKAHYGSVAKAQKELGIKARQTIYDWKNHGVPGGWQAKIQILTDGALKADEEKLRSTS